jgi:hypothetical protein
VKVQNYNEHGGHLFVASVSDRLLYRCEPFSGCCGKMGTRLDLRELYVLGDDDDDDMEEFL